MQGLSTIRRLGNGATGTFGHTAVVALFAVLGVGAALSPTSSTASAASDTPTTPIDSAQMSAVIAAGGPDLDATCEANAGATAAITELVTRTGGGADDLAMMMQLVDSYEIVQVEGDSLRLTPEARVVLLDWLHTDCV